MASQLPVPGWHLLREVHAHHKASSPREPPFLLLRPLRHHVHPTAGTIFHKSRTSLTTWFYAIDLVASTRCGIFAKQIEREMALPIETAWRTFKQIGSMLIDRDSPVGGKSILSEPPWMKCASVELADRRVKTKPRFPALELCSRKIGSRRLPART